jgi:hypothetical protein
MHFGMQLLAFFSVLRDSAESCSVADAGGALASTDCQLMGMLALCACTQIVAPLVVRCPHSHAYARRCGHAHTALDRVTAAYSI